MTFAARTVLALSFAIAGCADGMEPRSATAVSSAIVRWVGEVEESDVRFAMLVGRGKARLYFCGGAESYATATRWLNIGFDGGEHVDFQEQSWRVHGHLVGGGVSGEVELGDGVTRMFSAELVAPGTMAGLYEGTSECGRLGLIVTQAAKDDEPAAQGACVDIPEEPAQQVDAIAPITAEAGKLRVLKPGTSAATLLLQAATLDPL